MPLVHLYAEAPAAPARGSTAEPLPSVASTAALSLRMSRHFAQCRRENGRLALLWAELDITARPDDTVSEEERESLLLVASQRLRNRVRSTDDVVRVGDGHFAVLLLAAGAPEAELVERRLRQALRGAYGVDGRSIHLQVRLGTAVFPEDGRQGAELAEAARQKLLS